MDREAWRKLFDFSGNVTRQPMMRGLSFRADPKGYPNADQIMRYGTMLPCHPTMTKDDCEYPGHHHGEWRGELHVDGERIADCATPENARRLHQIRDTVVRVSDPDGGGEGWGNAQPIITGAHPALGLSAEDSFL